MSPSFNNNFGQDRPLPPLPESRGSVESAECWRCPFAVNGAPNRPVVGEGSKDPAWIIIGEGPGENEKIIGRPFIGASGAVMDKVLTTIGRPRKEVWTTNATCCQPYEGADERVRDRAADACRGRLLRELSQFPGKPILTVGAPAARVVLPGVFDVKKGGAKEPPTEAKLVALVDNATAQHGDKSRAEIELERKAAAKAKRQATLARKKLEAEAKANGSFYVSLEEPKPKAKKLKEKKPKIRRPKGRPKNKGLTFSDVVSTLHTSLITGEPRLVIPTIHPAAVLRAGAKPLKGAHSGDLVYWNLLYDAGKVDALARGRDIKFSEDVQTEVSDPYRATRLVLDIIQEAYECGECALDLETYVKDEQRHHALMMYVAQIKCIGLATPKRGIAIMWDLLGPYAIAAIREMLRSPKVVMGFHNALYDRTVLQGLGFELREDYFDTLLGHHATFPGAAHKLQFVAGQFYAIRPWKSEFRDNDETPESLTQYCLRAGTPVVLADGTTRSIETIVRRKQTVSVLSMNAVGEIEAKPVIDWHRTRVPGQRWVQIQSNTGYKTGRGLIVTPDHQVYTGRGKVRADQVKVDDEILISEPRWSTEQRSAMIGTLLGDSILVASPSERKDPTAAWRLALSGGHSNTDLVTLKLKAFSRWLYRGEVKPAREVVASGRRGQAKEFHLISSGMLHQMAHLSPLLYDHNWKRRIYLDTLKQLGPVGLAWWFMDDGCRQNHKHSDSVCFATYRYSEEDVSVARDWFTSNFGKTYVGKDRVIRLSSHASLELCRFIAPHVPPELRYKFPRKIDSVTLDWTEYRPLIDSHSAEPLRIPVTRVGFLHSPRDTRDQRAVADNRYCLTIKDNHNFFTSFGLVANCSLDTLTTARLRSPLEILVKKTATERVYEMDRNMGVMASRMHLWGVPMDRNVNEELLQGFRKNVNEAREQINSVANDKETIERIQDYICMEEAHTIRKTDSEDYRERYAARKDKLKTKIAKGDWAWSVDKNTHIVGLLKALGVNLQAKTNSGRTSTAKGVLESLVDVPIVRRIVLYRENAKLLSTFVWAIFDRLLPGGDVFYGFADEFDRVHPSWSITKISGRWASTEPVLSNVPKEDKKRGRPNLRKQVVAPKGRIFVGFDFGQVEGRVIGLVSGDPWLCKVFADGRDLHTEAMKIVWGDKIVLLKETDPKLFKLLRDAVKRFEYGAFYGGSVETLWKTLLKDDANAKLVDVQAAVYKLMGAMPNVVEWQNNSVKKASTPPNEIRSVVLGRRRVFPLIADRNEAINIAVQSTAADIMNTGMWRMWQRLPKYKWTCFPILQIHDATVFECNEDDADKVKQDVIECFTQEYTAGGITVPFPIECDIGQTWADV